MSSLKVAISQMSITASCRQNSKIIQERMREAAERGCTLVQFPEGALSGYIGEQIDRWSDVDWIALEDELESVKKTAKHLNIWVVVGGAYRLPAPEWPHNSLYVISNEGNVVARYDKRILSFTEQHNWFSPGSEQLIVTINGIKVGFALCIELQFPELFAAYRDEGVDVVLLSAYTDNPMFAITAQAHASINNIWVGFSVPTGKKVAACLIGPDGVIQAEEKDNLAIGTIDPLDEKWKIPIAKARPWRQSVRKNGYLSHDIL